MHDRERTGDWTISPRYVGEEHVELQLARYDVDSNTISRTLLHVLPSGTKFVTVTDTYAAPGELDIMASVTGFQRVARHGSWAGAEFSPTSSASISIFQYVGT